MTGTDPFDIANECIAFGVRRASRLVTVHFDRYLQYAGMRSTQFSILNALRALGGVTMSELAQQLETDRTTLSRNLRPLERKGWITRIPGKDRRSRVVSLTVSGSEALEVATGCWQTAQESLKEQLGRAAYAVLMSSLSELEEAFEGDIKQ